MWTVLLYLRGDYVRAALLLSFVGLIACAVAWGPCLAPWQVECFKLGDWGDYKFHYQGWISYLRGSAWVPPYLTTFSWPDKSSVMFTDSIPLAAILFKPITLLFRLPDWQYFSLLSILNSILIAWCSCRIGQAMRWKVITTLGCGLVLLTSSLSWTRLSVHHEALQLHGILILGLTWVITRQSSMRAWLCLIAASIGIHAYYLPLVLAAIFPYWLSSTQKTPKACAIVLVIAASAFLFGFLPGSLSSNSEAWGANLLTLIDPQHHSAIFSKLLKNEPYEIEGYAYLGLGILVGLLLALAKDDDPSSGESLFPLSWWLISIALFIFALGHTWNIADLPITPHKVIFAIPGASRIYDVFRSSGRFTWPITYSVSIWVFHRLNRFNLYRSIVPLVVALQLFDSNLKSIYRQGTTYSNILKSRDSVKEWAGANPMLARQLAGANILILGKVSSKAALPPPYTPQYLNSSIKSNWGGEGITRIPRSQINQSAFDYWASLVNAAGVPSPSCFLPNDPECYAVVFTDAPSEVARLKQLAEESGFSISKLSPTTYKVFLSR